MFKYLAIILLSAGASTCNHSNDAESQSNNMVEKTTNPQNITILHDIWALKLIEGVDLNMEKFPVGVPTIEIFVEEKRISGFSGCNNYFANIDSLDEKNLGIGPIAATKKYCMGVDEESFLTQLSKVNNYKIEKMHLFLFENDSLKLTFIKVD